ncbi:MAG TPA: zinc ribbon domain-containing protein [Verrucomicrobiae bacterium]|nr:zinc ribbon domain-containing protein [Verrucomicrobiae bacterium]
MVEINDPNQIVAWFGVAGLLLAAFLRLILWVRAATPKPEPWGAEVEQKLLEPETAEACPHCSTPLLPTALFCPHCGRAVDSYNNWVPYVYSFSDGDVFRKNTSGQLRVKWLIVIGYLLLFACKIGIPISPLLCIFFFLNQQRIKQERLNASNPIATPISET